MLSTLSLRGPWGIFCPGCKQTLSKAYWRNCQWNAKGGKGHHEGGDEWGSIAYTKCRGCQPRPIYEMDPYGLEETPPQEEMQWLSALLEKSVQAHFVEFITLWMDLIDAYTRKSWSYLGAVKGKRAGDHLQFDPGNWVYAQALSLLCPTLVRAVEWNDETKGDICEALLALHDDLHSPTTVLGTVDNIFKDLIMELAPLVDAVAYCVSKIAGRCPQSAERHFASLLGPNNQDPLPAGFWPNVRMPALPWRSESPTAQNQGSSNPPPALVCMDAQPVGDGCGFEPLARSPRAPPLNLSMGDGGAEAKCVRIEILPDIKAVRFDDCVRLYEGGGQGTAAGFQPLPAVDVGERRSGEEGGATGKGDGENKDNAIGFKLSPAEAGDGQGAEGKGDCAGNGEPAGFEPSPADAGKKKGGEGQGDGERQGNPTGFEPSPADITHTPHIESCSADDDRPLEGVWSAPVPHDGPLEGVWARRTRTWQRPSPRKGSVGLAASQDRSARGNDPAASRDRSDAGSSFTQPYTAKPRWTRANNAGSDTPRWADSCPIASAHGSGEGDAPVASTDPSPTGVEPQAAQMEAGVKEMDNEKLRALSHIMGLSFFGKAVADIVGGELHSRGLAVPHGFKPSAVEKEKGDESPGRPPSY